MFVQKAVGGRAPRQLAFWQRGARPRTTLQLHIGWPGCSADQGKAPAAEPALPA